jgi:hypothetical protein
MKIQASFFFDPKDNLLTGEETAIDLLFNGIRLCDDIKDHINGFLEELPELPEENASYLYCHDSLLNQYVVPIEDDEKDYFEQEFDDDFVIDESFLCGQN